MENLNNFELKEQVLNSRMKWVRILVNSLEDLGRQSSLLDTTQVGMSSDEIKKLASFYKDCLSKAEELKQKEFHKLCMELFGTTFSYDGYQNLGELIQIGKK